MKVPENSIVTIQFEREDESQSVTWSTLRGAPSQGMQDCLDRAVNQVASAQIGGLAGQITEALTHSSFGSGSSFRLLITERTGLQNEHQVSLVQDSAERCVLAFALVQPSPGFDALAISGLGLVRSNSAVLVVERSSPHLIVWSSSPELGLDAESETRGSAITRILSRSQARHVRTHLATAISEALVQGSKILELEKAELTSQFEVAIEVLETAALKPEYAAIIIATRPVPCVGNNQIFQGLEQAGEGFALTDKNGKFTYLNRAHVEMFGYEDPSELIGRHWSMLYTPEDAERVNQMAWPELTTNGIWNGRAPGLRRDGTQFEQCLTLSSTPDGWIACNCQDRMEELRNRGRLERQIEMFRKVAENIPSGILIRRKSGPYLFTNKAAQKFTGWSADDMAALNLGKVFEKLMLKTRPELSDDLLGPDTPAIREDIEITIEGRIRVIEILKFLIPDLDDGGDTICVVCNDHTDRRRVETELRSALKQKSEALTMQREFVSMISHEFRSPMAALQGAAHLIRTRLDKHTSGKIPRYLQIQTESLATLGELVDQVLLLNRLETTVNGASRTNLDLGQLVEDIVEYFNESREQQQISVDLTKLHHRNLDLDRSLIRAAVDNLVSNALKYSPANSPIEVVLESSDTEVEIRVIDAGRGIPEAEQSQLFQTFFRASNVGHVPGTGLGLRIALRAIDLHDGSITFSSTEGVGSTFIIKMPIGPTSAVSK
jgi:PAS domain S-box-containing protein